MEREGRLDLLGFSNTPEITDALGCDAGPRISIKRLSGALPEPDIVSNLGKPRRWN